MINDNTKAGQELEALVESFSGVDDSLLSPGYQTVRQTILCNKWTWLSVVHITVNELFSF